MKYLIIPILFYLGFIPPSGVPGYYELKFVALGGLVLILGLTYKPSFVKMDMFYGLFILACLFSMVDMQEFAWAWQPLFSWMAVILLAIWGRPFFKQNEILINVFLQVLYWATITYFAYHILLLKTPGVSFLELSYRGEMLYDSLTCNKEYYAEGWFKWFNNNFNMATMVPMILLAPVLFGKYFNGWWWIYRIVAAIPAFYLVHYFDSQLGVVVGLFYLIMIPFWYFPTKILLPTIALAAGGLYYFEETIQLKIKTFLNSGSFSARIPFDIRSIEMAKENPFNGTGLGSWFFEAGNGLVYNHNYHTKLLAEIGPFGWLVWILPVFILFFQRKKELAGYAMLLGAFYVSCLTLRPAVSDYVVLSEVHFMGILGYGLATMDMEKKFLPRGWAATALLLPLWFSFNFLSNHFYHKANLAAAAGDFCGAIQYLQPYYVPGLKTTVFDIYHIQDILQGWENNAIQQGL